LGSGVLTALLTFVPYLGPLIAAIPILVIGFTESVQTGLIVTVFYFTVQNVEANIVVPWIQHKVVHLAPALAISAQILLGLLFGLPGFILAAPLTVVGHGAGAEAVDRGRARRGERCGRMIRPPAERGVRARTPCPSAGESVAILQARP
jgi:predicted PurR-regulated permease PerM